MNQSNCSNHPDRPVHSKGLCKNCYDKLLKDCNPEYKKRQYENHKKWEEKNKDRVKEYQKRRRELHKERDKKVHLKSTLLRKYNLTIEDYEKLKSDSSNMCYICGRSPAKGRQLHVDHDHVTGKVRGLLCAQCNWYLGFIEKDPDILNKIKTYLNYE